VRDIKRRERVERKDRDSTGLIKITEIFSQAKGSASSKDEKPAKKDGAANVHKSEDTGKTSRERSNVKHQEPPSKVTHKSDASMPKSALYSATAKSLTEALKGSSVEHGGNTAEKSRLAPRKAKQVNGSGLNLGTQPPSTPVVEKGSRLSYAENVEHISVNAPKATSLNGSGKPKNPKPLQTSKKSAKVSSERKKSVLVSSRELRASRRGLDTIAA
jgi:hypothetical protein